MGYPSEASMKFGQNSITEKSAPITETTGVRIFKIASNPSHCNVTVVHDPSGTPFAVSKDTYIRGVDFSAGRAGIATKMRYAFGIPRQGF
jgi:hypothetical protein